MTWINILLAGLLCALSTMAGEWATVRYVAGKKREHIPMLMAGLAALAIEVPEYTERCLSATKMIAGLTGMNREKAEKRFRDVVNRGRGILNAESDRADGKTDERS